MTIITGIESEPNIRMINIFDNEECGSMSAQGAQSKLTELIMRRITNALGGQFERSIANSFLLSADQGMMHTLYFVPFFETQPEKG